MKLMAQMFNMTRSLRCPEHLVNGCLEMKTAKNLKLQTILNYLSIFKLFVDHCYLNREIAKCDDGYDRMKAAIAAACKAFSPAAALNAHQASEKKLALLPSNEQEAKVPTSAGNFDYKYATKHTIVQEATGPQLFPPTVQ